MLIGVPGGSTHKLAISRDTDGDNAYIHSYQDGVGAKNLILQPGGGKIGIGTIAPIRLFDLTGSLSGQYAAALINTSTTGHGLYIKAAPNSASYMALAVDNKDGSAILVARGDKRVGIGTNAPGYALDVRDWTSIGNTTDGGILRLEGKSGVGYAAELRTSTHSGLYFQSNGVAGPRFDVYSKKNSFGVGITPRAILHVAGAIIFGNANEDPHITKTYTGSANNVNAYTIDFTTGIGLTTAAGDYCTITWAKPSWAAVSWEASMGKASGGYKVVGSFYHNNQADNWTATTYATLYNNTSFADTAVWEKSSSSGQTVSWKFWIGSGHHPHIHMVVTSSGGATPDPADFTVVWTDVSG